MVIPPSSGASRSRLFDPSRGQPFVDEWSMGYRAHFSGQVSVDVGFVRRSFRNRTAAVEVNGIYDGARFRGYQDETQNEIYWVTGNRWNWQLYEGFEASAAKRTRSVEAIVGYTRAWRRIAGTWQPNDPASFLQPTTFANDRGLGGVRAPIPTDANSLSGTHMASDNLPWADHLLNGAVVWRAPWRLQAAASFTVQSGAWSGPIVTRLAAPDPSVGPPMVRLSTGRMVSNPLATTIRFAYDTRAEGQLQAPPLGICNVRVGRIVYSGRNAALNLSVDIFNLFNAGTRTTFAPSANQLYSAAFGSLSNLQPPRAARLLVSVTF
jgi:hypothetical protein